MIRFANRVPLLFQQSACSSFRAVADTNWRNYDLQQPRGGPPVGPLVIMIHMASVWVPFTSESKEAIADYDEIRKEMKLALMECGRKLGMYLKKRARMRREGERRDVFQKYIGEIAKAVSAITGGDAKKFYEALLEQAKAKTAIADLELDEEGKAIKGGGGGEDPADQDGVIIVEGTGHRALSTGGGQEDTGHRASGTRGNGEEEGARRGARGTKGGAEVGEKAARVAAGLRRSKRSRGGEEEATPPLEFSRAESAALKVAAMREEDEGPARGKGASSPKGEAKKGGEGVSSKSAKLVAGKVKGAVVPPEMKAEKSASKPKMRLVDGKLVPVEDGPKLFG